MSATVSGLSGNEMASGPQVLAQARQKTTQLSGLATTSLTSPSRRSKTRCGQNSSHSMQKSHLS